MIIEIGGECYKVRGYDPGILRPEDRGLLRAHKVKQDWGGFWFCCDDDDYLIDREGKIIAREIGWNLRREKME